MGFIAESRLKQQPGSAFRLIKSTARQRVPATCELPELAALGPAYELQMNAGTQSGDSRPPLAYVVCRLAIDESDEDQQARETYEKFLAVLKKNPRPGTALDKVIEYHTDNGTVDELIQQLREDAAANTTSWMIIGLLESHRQNHAEAVPAFEQAEAKRPDDALPSWMLGRSLAELDRHADAAVALERAITKNPDRASLLQIYQDLGARIDVLSSRTKRTTSGNAWRRSSPAMFESRNKSRRRCSTKVISKTVFDATRNLQHFRPIHLWPLKVEWSSVICR